MYTYWYLLIIFNRYLSHPLLNTHDGIHKLHIIYYRISVVLYLLCFFLRICHKPLLLWIELIYSSFILSGHGKQLIMVLCKITYEDCYCLLPVFSFLYEAKSILPNFPHTSYFRNLLSFLRTFFQLPIVWVQNNCINTDTTFLLILGRPSSSLNITAIVCSRFAQKQD